MPVYRVKHNGIIYIFPNFELYSLYRNGEAFIDKYGRLVNSQTKRVIKELEQIADERPIVMVQPPEEHPIRDAIADSVADSLRYALHQGIDWFVYEEAPKLWREKIKPGLYDLREYIKNGGKTKAELIIDTAKKQEKATDTQLSTVPKAERSAKTPMTEEEILNEQRNAVLHYIGLLQSLTKLHNAGVIDRNSTIEQLTNPAAIEQFNQAVSANPNLLEMTQSIELTGLLGRDLFQGGKFVPIEAREIEELAMNNDQEE